MDQTPFHKQIRDLGTCYIVCCYTIWTEFFWDCHIELWAIQLLGQNCSELLPKLIASPMALPATVTLSIKDVRRWNDDQWRELYTAMGVRGRVHSIYCQHVSVQSPTHWVYWNETQPTRNWTKWLLLLVSVSSCDQSFEKGKLEHHSRVVWYGNKVTNPQETELWGYPREVEQRMKKILNLLNQLQ